jgi:hypothetical protein
MAFSANRISRAFTLDLSGLKLQPPNEDLWVQYLQSGRGERIGVGGGGIDEPRLESLVVRSLIDFDEIAYEPNAEVLNDLAAQVVAHLRSRAPTSSPRRPPASSGARGRRSMPSSTAASRGATRSSRTT